MVTQSSDLAAPPELGHLTRYYESTHKTNHNPQALEKELNLIFVMICNPNVNYFCALSISLEAGWKGGVRALFNYCCCIYLEN